MTLEEINYHLKSLENSPEHKYFDFTLEEAKEYLSEEYIVYWKLAERPDTLRFFANTGANINYEIDRKFLISCYKTLKENAEKLL